MNYFSPKYTFFLILQLWLAPFFNFSPLSDLNYNLPQISGKIGFFLEKIRFFRFFSEKLAIFPRFFFKRFFHLNFFSTSTEKRNFDENRPKFPKFLSLAVRGRLLGTKPWDRIDKIFGTPNGAAVTATTDLGC